MQDLSKTLLSLSLAVTLTTCIAREETPASAPIASKLQSANTASPVQPETQMPAALQTATFGAGCFWCVEAVFEQIDGISEITSGYMGGQTLNPTYDDICTGTTGHAEVVQLKYDPAKISYEGVLKWFFKLHDPTTLNRQGADTGTQYRSAIFYHSEEQRVAAEAVKKKIDDAKIFPDPIVTEITKAEKYYIAEAYHQDFYRQNKTHGYCRAVISPKLDKLGLEK